MLEVDEAPPGTFITCCLGKISLRALGWKVLIVWECELRDEGVLAEKLKGVLS